MKYSSLERTKKETMDKTKEATSETAKQKEDNEVVKVMIHMYCKTHHHPDGYLCDECQELLDYVHFRRSKCPWGDDKPFCAHCPIQCYKPVMKERIRKVMKFSGPLISFVHPVLGFKHIAEAIPYLYKKARGIAPKMPPKKVKPKTDAAVVTDKKVVEKAEVNQAEVKQAEVKQAEVKQAEVNKVEVTQAEVTQADVKVEATKTEVNDNAVNVEQEKADKTKVEVNEEIEK